MGRTASPIGPRTGRSRVRRRPSASPSRGSTSLPWRTRTRSRRARTTLTAVLASSPAHGGLTFNADGSFTYAPAANFFGVDSFTYTATNGTLASSPATVSLTVNHVNQPPAATGASATTAENAAVGITLL